MKTSSASHEAASGDEALTIVVPAWKPEFLAAALQSLVEQTDQGFEVHIFDDAAVPAVADICASFPQFRYTRFEQNLGGQSLVAHWRRCLAQVHTPWVWLFADDDVMAPDSVAAFRSARREHPACRVVQMPVDMVSEDLSQVWWSSRPPAWESAADFLAARLGQRRLSCLPDHVFHVASLPDGLVDLPLAWNADDASWALLGTGQGLAGAQGGRVLWRQSALNISHAAHARHEKLNADLQFLQWLSGHPELAPTAARLGPRWLGTRLRRIYGFGGLDTGALLRRRQRVPVMALAWFWAVSARDLGRARLKEFRA